MAIIARTPQGRHLRDLYYQQADYKMTIKDAAETLQEARDTGNHGLAQLAQDRIDRERHLLDAVTAEVERLERYLR